ncbi:MAG: LTA synthase family protein [Acholeplasmataceae bacterium]|nr:LTA synthase family protein [Acholeplasmataceae bacterium]
MSKNHKLYLGYIGTFFVLNILNTYFLTLQQLNRYIAPFPHTFLGTLNAILGNLSFLLLVVSIAFLLFKTPKARLKFLLFTTLFLNFMFFASSVFNMYYGTSFSMDSIVMFKNPADGFAFGVILEIVLELIIYYRILLFLPFIILLVFYLVIKKSGFPQERFAINQIKHTIYILSALLMFFVSLYSYMEQFKKALPISSVQSTFAVQNFGAYPYYFSDFFGLHPEISASEVLNFENDQEMAEAFQAYNKNQAIYTNFFDGNIYSNRLTMDHVVSNLFVDETILNGSNLHGILEGRNLVLVHIESMNYFLFENDQTNQKLSFFNHLLDQSFVFRDYYSSVGMGVSSDAELSILTGLYPSGDRTLYWEHNKLDYELNSLVNYYNNLGYYTDAVHGDKETFYNRNFVYPNLYGFDEFYSLEDFIAEGYNVKEGYTFDQNQNLTHVSPWISDFHLADEIYQRGVNYQESQTPFMMFPIMMMPHTPYDFDPYGQRTGIYPEYEDSMKRITLKYLNYVDYYDDIMKRLFINEDGEDQTLDNTVYVFYSDHGSGLKNGDIDQLFNRELSVMESRKVLQQTLAFIYVPGEEYVTYDDYSIRKGLLTGDQYLVRSQVDLYRTIIELFNLPVGDDPYYGVHGLSTEPTFVLDNRLLDAVTDAYFFSMRNPKLTDPKNVIVTSEIYEYIKRFKLLSDYLLSAGDMQKDVNEAIKLHE